MTPTRDEILNWRLKIWADIRDSYTVKGTPAPRENNGFHVVKSARSTDFNQK